MISAFNCPDDVAILRQIALAALELAEVSGAPQRQIAPLRDLLNRAPGACTVKR